MESGTAEKAAATNGTGGNGAGESFEVHNPATGEVIRSVAIDSAESVRDTVARVRASQAEWEALGMKGRYRWLGQLRDWLLDNYDRVADTMQEETGKVRADAAGESVYLADIINFYGSKGHKYIGEEKVRPHTPLTAGEEAAGPVPALSGGRRDQPLELPADALARRRDAGAHGRRRRRDQAVRVHPAGPDRDRRGLEGRDRRARTCSTRSRGWARPARRWSTRSTSSSSPAPTAPAAR